MSAGLEEEAAGVCCEDARRAARAVGASVRTPLPEPVVWAFDASVLVASAAVACGESGSGLRGVSVCGLFVVPVKQVNCFLFVLVKQVNCVKCGRVVRRTWLGAARGVTAYLYFLVVVKHVN